MKRVTALVFLVAACSSAPSDPPTTVDPCVEVDELAAIYWEGFDSGIGVEALAVLAEQNPDCFDAGERMLIETSYRRMQRNLDG